MAVRSAEKRIAKWEAKMAGEALSVVTGRQLASMTDQVKVIFPELETLENEVKVVLSENAVPIILNPSYLNFARQIYRLAKRFSGTQLLTGADVYLNRWTAEGLDADILEAVRNVVFALTAPAP